MMQCKPITPLAIAVLAFLSGDFQAQAQSAPTVLSSADVPIVFNAADPPNTGQLGRRSDAGSRGCGESDALEASDSKPLLALVPVQKTSRAPVVFGKTAAEHPTFWFYVPHRSALTATFVLQDQDGQSVYQADVALPQASGILRVALPATSHPLATSQPYHWFFKLYCRSISPPVSFVEGWIQRESLTSDLTQQLKLATLPQQKVRLYAANGFWFDALTTAAELRHKDSSDAAWADLLRAIGLESVAAEAIATP